jgi:hypothetical protein
LLDLPSHAGRRGSGGVIGQARLGADLQGRVEAKRFELLQMFVHGGLVFISRGIKGKTYANAAGL